MRLKKTCNVLDLLSVHTTNETLVYIYNCSVLARTHPPQLFLFTTVSPVVSFDGTVAQNLNEADPLQLVCSVTEAWPQPTIVWVLDDSPLQNSSRLRIVTVQNITAASLYVTQSTLTIPRTLPNVDSGNYTCRTNQVLQGVAIPIQSVQARILVQGTNTVSGALVL